MKPEAWIRATADRLIEWDDRSHRFFKPYRKSLPVRALELLSKLADQPELRSVAGGLIIAGIFAGNDRMVRTGSRMMIAHEAATFTKDLLKTNIDRTRPRSASGRQQKKPRKGRHTAKEKTSFPSGHSAGAIAAARAFAREYPQMGSAALAAAAFLAVAQVPRGAHYPTDVAAGLAIGVSAEAVIGAAWDGLEMEERSRG